MRLGNSRAVLTVSMVRYFSSMPSNRCLPCIAEPPFQTDVCSFLRYYICSSCLPHVHSTMARSLDSYDSFIHVLLICFCLICLPLHFAAAAPCYLSYCCSCFAGQCWCRHIAVIAPATVHFLGVACYCFCRYDFCHFCFRGHSTTTLSVILLLPLPPHCRRHCRRHCRCRCCFVRRSYVWSVHSCSTHVLSTHAMTLLPVSAPGFLPGRGERNNAEVGTKSVPTTPIGRSFIIRGHVKASDAVGPTCDCATGRGRIKAED